MKKFTKILSLVFTVALIIGTISVGFTAYADSDDAIGSYDFTIQNPYANINWSTVRKYKGATHVHTVKSDADTEVDDMIFEYYKLGYDALALTDHGTVNYGWDDDSRITIFDYQYFVHGPVDELSTAQYESVIFGTRTRDVNTGKPMTEIPLGIELNGMSTVKCHVNGYYADAGHGDLETTTKWPRSAVKKNYDKGGFTHINHVGEWAEGNDSALVYNDAWLTDFTSIFTDYCPNRGGYGSATQTAWMNSHKGEAGCIGIELVNTTDNRTRNDRRYVYDEILKRLAPQGINVFGFCEDDAHEYSDCNRNAQFFLINADTTTLDDSIHNRTSARKMAYRRAMFYGEFYASSQNSKNSYELGDGFGAVGEYPSVSNIVVDESKNQVIITCKDATKVRLVADGNIVATERTNANGSTVVFDLNNFEEYINNYFRIYLTGAGGITYLQPFLCQKRAASQSTVQFLTPSLDTTVTVYNADNSVVSDSLRHANNYYVLPAGTYHYTASRSGYVTKTEDFTVTQADIQNAVQKKITIDLEEDSDVSFAYFYAPETIYVNPADGYTFEKYIDRENAIGGALHTDAQDTGNVFFSREGASNVTITCAMAEGNQDLSFVSVQNTNAPSSPLATKIIGGELKGALDNGQYTLLKWTATYYYKNIQYQSYTYSYVYKVPTGSTATLAAGGSALTKQNFPGWNHSDARCVSTVYAFGLHGFGSVGGSGYKYAPYSEPLISDGGPTTTGRGMSWGTEESRGGSITESVTGGLGYLFIDTSRVNNLSQVPYLKLGLDFNFTDADDYKANDGIGGYLTLNGSDLMRMNFTGRSSYTKTTVYNGQTVTQNLAIPGNDTFRGLKGTTLYCSDNNDPAKKLNVAIPNASTTYTLRGYTKTVKTDSDQDARRYQEVLTSVEIAVQLSDKQSLRAFLNDSVKNSFQSDWFDTEADWLAYQNTVAYAAKILGNPGVNADEVEVAMENLRNSENTMQVKTGTAIVKHYWEHDTDSGPQSGVIYSENAYTYNYNQNLTANAVIIAGYNYANKFECYSNGELIDSGTADFDMALASKENYEWRFYYRPKAYNVRYLDGVGNYFSTTASYVSYYQQNYQVSTTFPQRTGYSFTGWYLDVAQRTYSASETFTWNYDSDGDFTAQWAPLSYAITYDVNGGSSITVPESYRTATYGDTYSIISEYPTMTGYSFAGWKLNGGDNYYTAGSQLTWNIAGTGTFVAQWTGARYIVTFDPVADDATVSPATKEVFFNGQYGTLATATRTGYTATWYSNPNYTSSSVVNAQTVVTIPSDHTLYAKWTPTTYSISYNLGGGVVTGTNPESYTIESDSITLRRPTRLGHTFLGWSGTGIDTSEYALDVTIPNGSYGNRTYVAHWSTDEYAISYNLNGGTNDLRNPVSYNVNNAVTIYPATKSGYTFTGWTSPQQGSGTTINIPRGTTGNRDFTANWEIINYSITYNLNGGAETTNPRTYNAETPTFTLNAPVKTGFTFAGWDSNTEFTGQNVTIPQGTTGNLTFTATWTTNAYAITYIYNGGSVVGGNPTGYNFGDSFALTNPTKAGYNFSGWTKTANGTTITQTQGRIMPNDTGLVTFEANWTPVTYSINYNLDGGRLTGTATNPQTYNPESAPITLINPVRTGYTFKGWTGTGLASLYLTVVIPTGSIGDREYSANWEQVSYSITYDFNGGADSGVLPASYTSLDSKTVGAPIRPGYSFTGWNVSYENFTWTEGFINEQGIMGMDASYPDSYYSDGIVLRSGRTYNLSTTSAGGTNDLKYVIFDRTTGMYINTISASSYTPNMDCVAFILAYRNHTSQNVRNSVKLNVAGLQPSYAIGLGSTGNMHFVANWEQDQYTISYNLNGGSLGYIENLEDPSNPIPITNPTTYNSESSDILLNNPTKTGYNFLGWEYNGNVSTLVIISRGSTGNRVYTAQWEQSTYSITYNLDGGTVANPNPDSYTIESLSFTLNNPTKTGYTFAGWIGTGISGSAETVTVAMGSTGNRSYTATWTPITYSINYILDGGTNAASNPTSYTIETNTFSLSYPTKTGALFVGWSGTDISGTSTTVTIGRGSTGSREYTANWNITNYTIEYNLNGGAQDANNPNPVSYTVNSPEFTLSRPTRTGYTFRGWTGTGLSEVTEYVTVPTGSVGNRNYTANWATVSYSITYILDGGVVADDANPRNYTIETPTITLENPVRTGYNFAGWTGTGIEGTVTTVSIPRGSTGARTYTANWTVDGYTISYSGIEGATFTEENPTFYTITTPTFTLNNPTKPGYAFMGWSGTGVSGSGISTEVSVPIGSTGARSYTANWSLETYTISYNLDGGAEVLPNPTEYTYTTAPITLFNPVRAGYLFAGWEGTDLAYATNTVTIPTGSTGNRNYKATWSVGSYTITYNLNGGTVNGTNPTSYTYSSPDFTLINPTRQGYTFAGWSEASSTGTFATVTIVTGTTGNKVYTANWSASANVLTYDLRGGEVTGTNPSSYITNSGTLTIISPTKSGYKFNGWDYTTQDRSIVSINSLTKVAKINTSKGGAIAFTAKWTPINYSIIYNLNGGSVVSGNPTTYNVEQSFTLNNPTRAGYTFMGWSGTDLGDYKYINVSVPIGSVGARNYTANWSEQVYTITYDYDGGYTDTPNPVSYTILSPTINLTNPARTGYNFAGWTGSNGSTAMNNVTIPSGSIGNKNYTAHWNIITYAISYHGVEGARFSNNNPQSYAVTDPAITLSNPVKAGYAFLGWKGTGLVNTTMNVTIPSGSSGDRSYTAQWSTDVYTITYNLEGGTFAGDNATTYTVNSPKITLLNPSKTGYSFTGWTQSYEFYDILWNDGFINLSTGKLEFNNSTYPNSKYADPIVLRAGVTYRISGVSANDLRWRVFNLNGTYNTSVTSETYTPSVDCYCYILDYSNLGDAARNAIKVTATAVQPIASIYNGSVGNVCYTANWSAQSYTISYNGVAGAAFETANPLTYDAEHSYTLCNPTRTGYNFVGWTGTGLANTSTNVVIPVGSSGNRVYNAVWQAIPYSISVSLGGGTVSTTIPESYTVLSDPITLPLPTRTGYTFVGWTGTGITGTVANVTINTGSTGDRAYEAVWTARPENTHRVYFYGYSNQPILFALVTDELTGQPKKVNYCEPEIGADITIPEPPQTVGYIFDGWDIDVTLDYYKNLESDITVHAKYKYGPDMYEVIINGGAPTMCTQYQSITASAYPTSGGKAFSYWIDYNTGEIISYFMNYTFRAHSNINISAVYGASESGAKAATRVTKVELYKEEYDWFTVYVERSVATGYTVLQHGVLFTDDASKVSGDTPNSSFEIGNSNVFNGVASSKTASGVWTLSIKNPAQYGANIYLRSYVTVVDGGGNVSTVYSSKVKTYVNNEDLTP